MDAKLAAVNFYAPEGENGWLASFSPHKIVMCGRAWNTVEHYYQAMKFSPGKLRDRIANAGTPMEAKRIAKSNTHHRRPDWSRVSSLVMYNALRAKFRQHQELGQKLLSTTPSPIREVAPSDWKWGTGADGNGENRMGSLLMAIRAEIGRE